MNNQSIPLCVDLDGTLVRTDLLWETLVLCIKSNPLLLLLLPIWLLKGKAFLKQEIAKRVCLDASLLPYRESVLEYIREESNQGRKVILATASDESLAANVMEYLKCFDGMVASDGKLNMKGTEKARVLTDLFGVNGFEYIGDSKADLNVWEAAQSATVINGSSNFLKQVEERVEVKANLLEQRSIMKALFKGFRTHQWVKNLLVFVPLLAAHQLGSLNLFLQATIAFVTFSLVASSVYLINDLMDIDADRNHIRKCNRPIASGDLPITTALVSSFLLLCLGIGMASALSVEYQLMLTLYFIATLLYSIILKRLLLIDVFSLAALYTLRIFAGGVAVGIPPSQWLLAFSMFLFLSLAFVKRYTELASFKGDCKQVLTGRAYNCTDQKQLALQGLVSGYLSVLVLALYISSEEAGSLYQHPDILWLIPICFLYWISRIWMLTSREEMDDDPVVFTLKDKVSYFIVFTLLGVLWAAS